MLIRYFIKGGLVAGCAYTFDMPKKIKAVKTKRKFQFSHAAVVHCGVKGRENLLHKAVFGLKRLIVEP